MTAHTRGVVAFLVLTFGLTWLVELRFLPHLDPTGRAYMLSLVGVMFIPALCALIVRVLVERSGFSDAGLRWGGGFRWYALAWLLPAAIGWVAMLLALLLRQAEWDPYLTELLVRMQVSAPQMRLPPLPLIKTGLLVTAFTWAVIPNTITAFGEEFGWRGYLLTRLQPLGTIPALLLTGAIWGVWHAPIIAQGYNFPQHPRVGVLVMVGACVALGVVLGWLRLASGSVFVSAVGHGSVNGPASTPLAFLRGRQDLTTGPVGLLAQAVAWTVILGLWRLGALRVGRSASEGEKDAGTAVPEQREQ